jgi:hypothetical protein
MTERILEQTETVVKFSDMETGASGWVMLAGSPTAVIKTTLTPWGTMASNARRIGGKNGKTFVSTSAVVYPTSGECRAGFEAKRQAFLESRNEQERPFVYGHPANGYL